MTTARAASSNKSRSLKFRKLVSLVLDVAGIHVTPKPEYKKISEAVRDDLERGDLQGLAGWAIVTRNEIHRDLSGGLDLAVQAAEHDGKPRSAVIWHRSSREPEEAFVVMTLATFAQVLRAEQNEVGQ